MTTFTARPAGPLASLRRLPALLTAVVALALVGCGDDEDAAESGPRGLQGASVERIERNPANANVSITVGSKNFTEQQVLGHIYAQGLRAAGYQVETELDLGDERVAMRSLKSRRIEAYPEYTGTALLSIFGVAPEDVPQDPTQAFEMARARFAERGLVAFPPTPFTSANEVAVTQQTAEEQGLQKISDLEGKAKGLTLYGPPECSQRLDCAKGLGQIYGLEFEQFVPVEIDDRHEVLTNGKADVSIVFTTDPQIKREGFVLLEDDKGMNPPQNSGLVVRKEVVDRAGPDLQRTITLLQQDLTDEAMQELNARVDLDGKDAETVAREYLRDSDLVG